MVYSRYVFVNTLHKQLIIIIIIIIIITIGAVSRAISHPGKSAKQFWKASVNLPQDEFSWNFILGIFIKICPSNSMLVNISRKSNTILVDAYINLIHVSRRLFLGWKELQKQSCSTRKAQTPHLISNTFLRKSFPLRHNCKNHSTATDAKGTATETYVVIGVTHAIRMPCA